MRFKHYLLVIFLFLCTLVPMFYKSYYLNMDLIPKNKTDVWELEFLMNVEGGPELQKLQFPVPRSNDRIDIQQTQFEGKNLDLKINQTAEGAIAQLTGMTAETVRPFYRVHMLNKAKTFEIPKEDYTRKYTKDEADKFLNLDFLDQPTIDTITELESEIIPKSKNKVQIAKAIFYFIHEEIIGTSEKLDISQVIEFSRGRSVARANVFTVLARRQGIPARTIRGIRLLEDGETKRSYIYWNEIYLGNEWIPVIVDKGKFGSIYASYIPLYSSKDLKHTIDRSRGKDFSIHAKRLSADSFNIVQYRKQLAEKSTFFYSFSPYMLPISYQSTLRLLLLFCVGTVMLSVCRNLIGIKTFGIFFPILLTLFFKETSLMFGMMFFFFVVLLGVIERYFLYKLYLLAVPRFSIILTLLVISLFVFAILNNVYQISPYNPALMPIIITTMFVERFSIMTEEEGTANTFKTFIGTMAITVLTYLLFQWKDLESLIYTHPEILFSVIACQILIGKYAGYRLSELIRFRAFSKHA